MNSNKIYTSIIVLIMCLMPVAGMTFEMDEINEAPSPEETMTITTVYGWVNDTGGSPMPNTYVIFQDAETQGIEFSNSTNVGKSYFQRCRCCGRD